MKTRFDTLFRFSWVIALISNRIHYLTRSKFILSSVNLNDSLDGVMLYDITIVLLQS